MLIEQIDDICPESFERGFSNFLDVLWPAVHADGPTLFGSSLNPNFVAITTASRNGASASPTVPRS
jgi:hypothetical protein